MKKPPTLFIIAALLALSVYSCDITLHEPDPPPIEITQIKEVIVTPDTAQVGELIQLHCVLEDTTSPERWVFDWVLIRRESDYLLPIKEGGRVDTALVIWDSFEIEEGMRELNLDTLTFSGVVFVDDPNKEPGNLVRAAKNFKITLLLN